MYPKNKLLQNSRETPEETEGVTSYIRGYTQATLLKWMIPRNFYYQIGSA